MVVIFYRAGSRTAVEDGFIKFNLSAATYSIDDFNAKVKVAVFVALGILDKYLEKNTLNKSTLPPGSYKTSLDTTPPPKSLSLHCKQIMKSYELHGQPSSLLACIEVSDYKAAFIPMHLVFLELDTRHYHLDFKLLDENNTVIIPRTFYLQLLSKDHEYIR